jgi:hypothetical protein
VPRLASLGRWHGDHGRQTGGNGTVSGCFAFGRHIDAEAVPIGEPQEGQVLALAEVVVRVGETTAPAIGGNNALMKRREILPAVCGRSPAIVTPQLTGRQERIA